MQDHTYYLRLASQHYLTEEIPSDWDDLDIYDQSHFIHDHRWEPFLYTSTDELFEHIEDLAEVLKQVAQNERIATLDELSGKMRDNSDQFNAV